MNLMKFRINLYQLDKATKYNSDCDTDTHLDPKLLKNSDKSSLMTIKNMRFLSLTVELVTI